jgi:hypothetical protein
VVCFLRTKKEHQHHAVSHLFFALVSKICPSGGGNGWLFCVCSCVTFEVGDLSSASRLSRACSVGASQGVALQIEQVAKGRPLRLMRINGRSGEIFDL